MIHPVGIKRTIANRVGIEGFLVKPVDPSMLLETISSVFSAAGDILFADTSAENVARMGPLVDLLFVTSYLFGAHGTRLQYQLLAG